MGVEGSPEVIGRYAIYAKFASGGMASVHFGRLLGGAGFSRTVAIKRLHPHLAEDPDFLSTMIDEARLAARIQHPNVVPTLDVVAAEGELLLVMEYVRGESLARLVKIEAACNRRLSLPIASAIVIGALHGLHAAHEATSDQGAPLGIVHRDVSPQNILVGVDGLARVIDFGIAKATGRLQTTQQGEVKGKVPYMAPEQLAGRAVSRTADVYAMGVVLWEMLTGSRLFSGDTQGAVVAKVLAGATDPPSRHAFNLPAGLDELVMKALARDPADRFASALDMAEKLLRVVPPAFPTDVGRWCARAAHESLVKRGALLAEIESSSGRWPGLLPAPGPESPMGEGSAAVGARCPDAVDQPLPTAQRSDEGADAEAPTLASQSSSLSMEAPTPSSLARWPLRRAMLVGAIGAMGGVVVAGLAAAVWSAGGARVGADHAGATTPVGEASVPLPLPGAATHASASVEPPDAPAVPATVPPVLPAGPGALRPSAPVTPLPASKPGSLPPRNFPAPSSAAPPSVPKPKSTTNCSPPFWYDGEGNQHFKSECFMH